jgi:conjugal transfer pilus assembly protein TraD
MRRKAIEQPLRPVFEAFSALAWLLAGAWVLGWLLGVGHPDIGGPLLAFAVGMFAWRVATAFRRYAFRLRLCGCDVQTLPAVELERHRSALGDRLWLGWGFRWHPSHAQLAHDVLQRDLPDITAPGWLRWIARAPDPARSRGLAWIHALGRERDLVVPMKALEGHTAVLAVTGAMKTVLARLLVWQLAARGDTVIVIDPKGDRALEALCREVPRALGRPERHLSFQPAFPHKSVRFDALSSWDRETQVASRLRLLLPGADDNFIGFAWMTVARLVAAMAYVGRRPSIVSLLDCLQSRSCAEALALAALQRHAGELPVPEAVHAPGRASPFVDPRLAAAVARWRREVPAQRQPAALVGLLSMLESDRQWFDKMALAITPLLTKLSAGGLRELLSPDYDDFDDERAIFTTRDLVAGGHVAYFGLDALSDTSVAEAIVALLLADLAATAGEIYNHGEVRDGGAVRRVHVLCDEWGDVVCDPLVQLANKARGAGIVLYLFGQTFADLVVKMGDVHKARRVLGNMNNLVVGATADAETLEIVASKVGETSVRLESHGHATSKRDGAAGFETAANRSVSIATQVAALVPTPLLTGLPDLQFFAVLNRAQVYKGRLPVLTL